MSRLQELPIAAGVPVSRHPRERFYESREHPPSIATRLIGWLQHRCNALHVMVLFVAWGMPQPRALAVARRWERVSHRWLYPDAR
jgi:hypothetical protein